MRSRWTVTLLSVVFINACGAFTDESVRLARQIEDASAELRRSGNKELVLTYRPQEGVDQNYSVGIGKTVWCPGPPCLENTGGLTVEVERGNHGSTTYYMRFVAVPKPLQIQKNGQPTVIVLRANGDTIDLVDLR